MTMRLIETKTLGADAASIEFTSIPQTFTDLVALVSARTTVASVAPVITMTINGVSTDRTARRLAGNGSTVESVSTTDSIIGSITGANATANTFGNGLVYLPNYSGNSAKSFSTDFVTENNGTESNQRIYAALWNSTAAITSLTFSQNGNFVVGSTVSLYGITKGSDGSTTVS